MSKRNKEPIKVIMMPIDNKEEYNINLANVMFDIIEKQCGKNTLELSMEELKRKLGR